MHRALVPRVYTPTTHTAPHPHVHITPVTRCVRYAQHHLELRRKTRAKIRRFFDRRTLCHYYYNPVYGSVSWRKPYCIRLTDLFPFLDEYMAATWIQGMYHQWYAHTPPPLPPNPFILTH